MSRGNCPDSPLICIWLLIKDHEPATTTGPSLSSSACCYLDHLDVGRRHLLTYSEVLCWRHVDRPVVIDWRNMHAYRLLTRRPWSNDSKLITYLTTFLTCIAVTYVLSCSSKVCATPESHRYGWLLIRPLHATVWTEQHQRFVRRAHVSL